MRGRIASLIVVLIYIIFVWHRVGFSGAEVVMAITAAPLFMIWCSDTIGNITFPQEYGYVDKPTPGWLIALVGWAFLLLPTVWWIFLRK